MILQDKKDSKKSVYSREISVVLLATLSNNITMLSIGSLQPVSGWHVDLHDNFFWRGIGEK